MSAASAKTQDPTTQDPRSQDPKSQDPSMEDILASIRRIISDDQDSSGKPGETAAPATSNDRHQDDEVLDLAMVEVSRQPAKAPDLEVDVPDLSFQSLPEPMPAAADDHPRFARAEPAAAPVTPPAEPAPSHSETPFPRLDTLVSNETTAAVGHAFNLLSHTILTQNARTLEDLVKEMLKPMLKTWLDDNLPPLVERLVRQEIERVARGNR